MKPADIESSTRPLLDQAVKLEKEARELRALAKEVEERLRKISGSFPAWNDGTDVTLDHLKSAIKKKGGRVSHYAERLHTTELRIRELINHPDSGIRIGQKGWIELTDPFL